MGSLILTFVGLAIVVVIAAKFLAEYADRIAEQTGLGGGITGLVLLASATSLPEFSIGYNAVKMGAFDLTAGDVLGSSLINLLILAVLDLIFRSRESIFSKSSAAHALAATVACLLTAMVLLGMLLDVPWTFLRLGPVSWCVILTYLFCARLLYLDQVVASKSDNPDNGHPKVVKGRLPFNLLAFGASTAVIFLVAPYLAHTADKLSAITGLGRSFFGTVFVAFMTSLPEAVATLTAIRLGAREMAVGNILGSNAFNMTILTVLDVATPHPILSQVADVHLITAGCVLIVTCVTTLCLLYRAEKRWWLIEPDAALVTLLIVGSLYLVFLKSR